MRDVKLSTPLDKITKRFIGHSLNIKNIKHAYK